MMKQFGAAGLATVVLLASVAVAAEVPRIRVQTDKPAHAINPAMWGIFFEDINYAADGGLYAELVQNRSFEFKGRDALFAWSAVETGGGKAALSVETDKPLNENNPHYLRLKVEQAGGGVANGGFGGIVVRKGAQYLFSMYARTGADFGGSLTVQLVGPGGTSACPAATVAPAGGWKKYECTLDASADEDKASLVIRAGKPGTVELDMVSLFPRNTFKNRPNGLRADLAQMLADIKPGFVRFPGGCIVEGKDLPNAYRWKDTIGDVAQRKHNWNRWQNAVPAKAPQYYQSYGLGFFEFFQFCEDIGAEPLPVLNCGMSCQYQDKQLVSLDKLGPWVQDALDLIEFANGPAGSAWGARRAAMGHPAPFSLKYLAIGNEQWGDDYFERYKVFQAALAAKYPDIRIISSAGPGPDGAHFNLAMKRLKTIPAHLVDEHYYRPPQWFLDNTKRYDNYDRKGIKVFAGEYAAHTKDRKNNLGSALAEAAFMTGLERNADVVQLASYAPLFAKIGSTQWNVDLIWFDNLRCYGTPNYHVQKLFATNRGDVTLPTEVAGKNLYANATRDDKAGEVILKVVNVDGMPMTANVKFDGAAMESRCKFIVLSGKESDENSLAVPDQVQPKGGEALVRPSSFRHVFPAHSLTVMRLAISQK